jgi:glycerol-1-phosphate dehydrogenase [NAD(P)+]
MTGIDKIYIGPDATGQLLSYAAKKGLKRFVLIADDNTYRALGTKVEGVLKAKGYEVSCVVLEGASVHPDEHRLIEVLIKAPLGECTFIAVGSGTITDTTRFVSHRTGRAFIAMPTAPSVDGFTSVGAPLILAGVKTTILCQAPIAVFADLETLVSAPSKLIAAGYGDMLGKITSLADWELGCLLWDEPYDPGIAKRSQVAIDAVMKNVDSIGRHSEDGVRALMEALIESGLCMLDFGTSRPASGAEHHASHYWEMKRLEERETILLHGAQVGYALTLVAQQYARIRALSRQEVLDRLSIAKLPDRGAEIAKIREGYGHMAEEVMKEALPFLDLTEDAFENLKHRIVSHWEKILVVASKVPSSETLAGYLHKVGAPTSAAELGLKPQEVAPGFEFGHYLRNRFTSSKAFPVTLTNIE